MKFRLQLVALTDAGLRASARGDRLRAGGRLHRNVGSDACGRQADFKEGPGRSDPGKSAWGSCKPMTKKRADDCLSC